MQRCVVLKLIKSLYDYDVFIVGQFYTNISSSN